MNNRQVFGVLLWLGCMVSAVEARTVEIVGVLQEVGGKPLSGVWVQRPSPAAQRGAPAIRPAAAPWMAARAAGLAGARPFSLIALVAGIRT